MQGLDFILESYTTNVIFSSKSIEDQADTLFEFLELRKKENSEVDKHLDDSLLYSPFSLIAIYAALNDSYEIVMT